MDCCKLHKEVCTGATSNTDPAAAAAAAAATANTTATRSKYVSRLDALSPPAATIGDATNWEERFEELEDGWKITNEMKEALHNSPWLRSELQDPGLRALLTQIATASNHVSRSGGNQTEQEDLLQNLRGNNPALASFLDKTMVLTGIMERQGEQAQVPVEEWLQANSDSNQPLNVTLKPLPRRKAMYSAIASPRDEDESSSSDDNNHSSSEEDSDKDSEDDDDDDSSSANSEESS